MSFSANWNSRGWPDWRIWPNAGDCKSFTGKPRFGWLNRLKHSARNCSRIASLRLKFLNNDRSTDSMPGPRTRLRPSFPNCPAWVSGFNCWKAERLTHWLGVCGPAFGSLMTFGRLERKPVISGAEPCSATFALSYTVNGVPEARLTIVLNCQPFTKKPAAREAPDHVCSTYVPLNTKRLAASNREGPYSAFRLNGFCAKSVSPATIVGAEPDTFRVEMSSRLFDHQ